MDFDQLPTVSTDDSDLPGSLELGAFSISLNVADLERSRQFYAALGFETTGGDPDHGYLILKNGEATIGIFSGVIDANILTFNPGLTSRMERIEQYTDVRQIQARLEEAGLHIDTPVDPEAGDSGPAWLTLADPDGNQIMIDQFF